MKRTTPERSTRKPVGVEKGKRKDLSEVRVLTFSRTPSKFTERMPHQIYTMATLGLTLAQMADSLGIGQSTLGTWLQEKPECRAAYEQGKESFDMDIELALRQKALGYEYERTKHYSGVDSLGREWTRSVTETIRVEGDITAQKFWLSNRQPGRWRELSALGSGSTNIQVNNINMEDFTEEEKKLARSMAIKQLEGMNVISGSDTGE